MISSQQRQKQTSKVGGGSLIEMSTTEKADPTANRCKSIPGMQPETTGERLTLEVAHLLS